MRFRAACILLLACTAMTSGCATVTGSETQAISVATFDSGGETVAGADCRLTNNNGTWTVKTPDTVNVRKSFEDLVVRCEAEERQPGTTHVVSRVNGAIFGNAIIGGIVGAAIDHTKGTAYDYPTSVRVVFGMSRRVESDEVTFAGAPASAAVSSPRARPEGKTTLDDLDGLLRAK